MLFKKLVINLFIACLFLSASSITFASEVNDPSAHVETLGNECREAVVANRISKQKGTTCQKVCLAVRVQLRRIKNNTSENIQKLVNQCEERHASAMSCNVNDKVVSDNPRGG